MPKILRAPAGRRPSLTHFPWRCHHNYGTQLSSTALKARHYFTTFGIQKSAASCRAGHGHSWHESWELEPQLSILILSCAAPSSTRMGRCSNTVLTYRPLSWSPSLDDVRLCLSQQEVDIYMDIIEAGTTDERMAKALEIKPGINDDWMMNECMRNVRGMNE